MKPLKTAVIGVGSMGRNHARLYAEFPDVEFVAVADTDDDLAQAVAHKYGVKSYSNYIELLEKEQPVALSIAVPTSMHEEVAIAALHSGADVLIEKPIASTVEEGKHLIQVAENLDRRLMVGHVVRFNPAIRALKKKLQAGELGRIFQIACRRVGPFPARIRDVGVAVDLAPHDIDVMRYLAGESPDRVYAETERRIHTEHEDLVLGLLHFPGGITGALEVNWLTPSKVREIFVLGERGMFRVDNLSQDLFFYENADTDRKLWPTQRNIMGVSEGRMVRFPLDRYEPLRAELEAFLSAIRNNEPMPISGEDGLEALRIAQALVASGQQNKVMKV